MTSLEILLPSLVIAGLPCRIKKEKGVKLFKLTEPIFEKRDYKSQCHSNHQSSSGEYYNIRLIDYG